MLSNSNSNEGQGDDAPPRLSSSKGLWRGPEAVHLIDVATAVQKGAASGKAWRVL